MQRTLLLFSICTLGVLCLNAQETAKTKMQRQQRALDSIAVVSRFDGAVVLNSKQLRAKNAKNEQKRQQLLRIIDAAELKERQKEKLRYDVYHNPFSARLKKFVQTLKATKTTDDVLAVIEEK